jgi:SnoaL-like domain
MRSLRLRAASSPNRYLWIVARGADPRADRASAMYPSVVVRKYLEALNSHEPTLVCSIVHPEFFNEHISRRGESLRGRDAYRARLDGFFASMLDLSYELEHLIEAGDQVAVAYRMSARWVPPSSKEADPEEPRPFSIRGVFWFTVTDGLISHRVDYRDGVDFEEQVGLRN